MNSPLIHAQTEVPVTILASPLWRGLVAGMATLRDGWKLPDAPACKKCGATMRLLKHWHPETPLQWTCQACQSSRLDPIIEWPFLEAVSADRELEALGFIVAQPEEVDYAEARALASKYNKGYRKPTA